MAFTMTGKEIRERFLRYFEGKEHVRVESSSLIPKQDPTLLFTNAGMVQFKGVFLGEEKRAYTRATTSQKCLRAGGKHNDLENVGKTTRHHTFFEMLGNFSFGDYFKREAIEMGWEFLTKELSLSVEKLWVTVFREDDEAHTIWRDVIGVPADRIVGLGEKDNFWSMGDTGPCGPCSEIIIDQGAEVGCRRDTCSTECGCDRFLELWNLVFMQFDRDQKGTLTPLPKPSIDTGMGLERISAVVQGLKSNYETDLFLPIIHEVGEMSQKRFGSDEGDDTSVRVIADHSRAITFLINDGILPGNEGRGYVLRRILRRASYHGKRLGLHDPFLYRTCNLVVDMMQEAYPDLKRNRNYLLSVVKSEEERFSDTLDSGLKILHEEKSKLVAVGKKEIPGDLIFRLYDTHGFPFDLISNIVEAEGWTLDEAGFHQAMGEQRQRSRQFWKGSGEEQVNEVYKSLVNSGMKTSFVGYTTLTFTSPVLALIRDGRMIEKAQAGDTVEIVTEKTPFYGESGGQSGDSGVIESTSCTVEIEGAMKPVPDLVIHKGRLTRGELKAGDVVTLKVEAKKRQATALNHTATHLLQYALRKVLGDHVHQAGSLVSPERLRFDFTHFSPMTERELDRVEELINGKIRENILVDIFDEIPLKEAQHLGATALFGEKYGEKVRVVKVGDYSLELCGGTHTHMTGDIGLMKIVTEGGVSAGVRRIEALTGHEAFAFVREKEKKLAEIAQRIKASPSDIVQKVTKILNEQKELQKEISALKGKLFTRQSGDILEGIRDIGGVKVLAKKVETVDPKGLREVADRLKEKIGSGIILLGAVNEDRVLLLARITDDLTPRFHAGKIVGAMAKVVGGKGGGRPDMAQAGGKTVEKLKEALETGIRVIEGNVDAGN